MNIIIYTKTGCPWCNEALAFLNSKHIKFEERNVTLNSKFFDEMILKSGQSKAPTLDIDNYILGDSDAGQIEKYLKEKMVI